MKNVNRLHRKSFFKDIVFAVMVIILPFLFFLYNLAPNDKQVWETYLFTIDVTGFEDVNYYLWLCSSKVLLILILMLWYLSCRHWWRFAMLVPICVELYKLVSVVFFYNSSPLSSIESIYCLGTTLAVMMLLLILSKKLKYYASSNSFNKELNDEINELMNKVSNYETRDYKEIRLRLIYLREQKHEMDIKEYLQKLIALRDSIVINQA